MASSLVSFNFHLAILCLTSVISLILLVSKTRDCAHRTTSSPPVDFLDLDLRISFSFLTKMKTLLSPTRHCCSLIDSPDH